MYKGQNQWVKEATNRMEALAEGIAGEEGRNFILREVNQVNLDLQKINAAFDEGDYFRGFILQRQLRRNLNRLPNAFRRFDKVPETAKNKFNELIFAIQPANTYTRFIGDAAQRIENAKNTVQSNLIEIADLGAAPKTSTKLPGYISKVREKGAQVVAAIKETPELSNVPEVQEIFQRFSGSLDGITSKSEALADYDSAIEGMRQILGIGADLDADTLQQVLKIAEERGVKEVVGKKFDDAIDSVCQYVSRLDDP